MRRSWANRPLGISSRASIPVSLTGTLCGQTGEKWSARRVFFHVDGVTGGMYLNRPWGRERERDRRDKSHEKISTFGLLLSGLNLIFLRKCVGNSEASSHVRKKNFSDEHFFLPANFDRPVGNIADARRFWATGKKGWKSRSGFFTSKDRDH